MFNPFHPLLIPQQPCVPTFFGKYSSSFQVAANQSAIEDLEKNDLQVGMGTPDNTGSKVEFNSMVHSMGLVNLTLGSKTVPSTRVFKPGSTSEKLFDRAPTTSITATSNFTASVASNSTNSYKKSTGIYLLVGKPSTTVTFTGNSSDKYTWNATYTFSKNTGEVKTVTPSREYDNAGWGFDYTGAVQTFTAPENAKYKLEVWGAQGGNCTFNGTAIGGNGGYSIGKSSFTRNRSLYVVIGGEGGSKVRSANDCASGGSGGFNGGGNGGNGPWFGGAGGGGATHIAVNGRSLLSTYLKSYTSDILLVAGGGGGAASGGGQQDKHFGGVGGGKEGGASTSYLPTPTLSVGGSQNSGFSFGKGQDGIAGSTGSAGCEGKGGGGGGLWGGYASQKTGDNSNGAGGGGSGYINTSILTDASTIAGNTSFPSPSGGIETGHEGNGYAIITQVSY